MKRILWIGLLWLPLCLSAQVDSLVYESDTIPRDTLPPLSFKFKGVGLWYSSGNQQYFDGYTYRVMNSNALFGLPLLNNWEVYSPLVTEPKAWEAGGSAWLGDTARHLRLRLDLSLSYRKDSLLYTSGFALNDTVYGRAASEQVWHLNIGASLMRTTRKLANLFYLYGGAGVWVGFAPSSSIHFVMYEYDFGDNTILSYDEFDVEGKARFQLFANALIGGEAVLADRLGILAEVRSGLGAHIIPSEPTVGMSRTFVLAGLNYYFQQP